ncbi:MAG: valine--tRNA ligase [Bacteroidales bacterium]|jgi:valyl-tRNA synthetase|nr:valine--tRNA ligase [Bacteroidales bacterium]
MELPTKYDPTLTEDKWYAYWLKHRFFHSEPDERAPYTIVIPPPNVTGVLHMGHILNNTIQDIIIRRTRMMGCNACWVPGTDHASIATEAKVVAKLAKAGISKKDISREEFLKHAWEWKEEHGGIILEQLKKLGASCDWERTSFTMDPSMYESVIDVFIDLYNKGLIYRGVRMVNWDPKALTAVSDEEVNYKEVNSALYYVRYKIEDCEDEWITIATTRPETILGDTAVCVHPEDERYQRLKGKRIIIPLVERSVPLIFDEYVEREFGTGALKVTPAHDINDYNLGIKHQLESIDIFNDNGTLNEKAQLYIGEDRFVVREKITEELRLKGHLVKTEPILNKVGFSERTDEVIEPKLSMQWFMKMSELAKPALNVVLEEKVKFYPQKYINTYRHWMENVKDWCISRQLWWGQRIPAYYLPGGKVVVAKSIEDAAEKATALLNKEIQTSEIKQDEDVLDTWFSSWLWPISVFDGIRKPDNPDIKYYYPTNDLITAPDILFFWVARMIMAGLEYRKSIPFSNVYLTGMVRDKQGRKMSKSLGNSPEPMNLIKNFGADGVRMGMLLASPAGNDLLFDETQCEQGRNFSNKIWNAFRLIKGWHVDESLSQPEENKVSIQWVQHRLNEALEELNSHYEKYRISDALMTVYKLIWDDFCSWYLEMIKPAYQKPIDKKTLDDTVSIFEKLMQLLHPFMPFITEELWQQLRERKDGESVMMSRMPEPSAYDKHFIESFSYVQEVISQIRMVRKEKNIAFKDAIDLMVRKNNDEKPDTTFDTVAGKLCNIKSTAYVDTKPDNSVTFLVRSTEFYIPLENSNINIESELNKLHEELKYFEGFLISVNKKLSNERFVKSAPEQVVAAEMKKKADAESKIRILTEQIQSLKQ